MFRKIVKEVKRMAKELTRNEVEVINTKKEAFFDLVKDEDASYVIGKFILWGGVAVIGVGISLIGFGSCVSNVSRRSWRKSK